MDNFTPGDGENPSKDDSADESGTREAEVMDTDGSSHANGSSAAPGAPAYPNSAMFFACIKSMMDFQRTQANARQGNGEPTAAGNGQSHGTIRAATSTVESSSQGTGNYLPTPIISHARAPFNVRAPQQPPTPPAPDPDPANKLNQNGLNLLNHWQNMSSPSNYPYMPGIIWRSINSGRSTNMMQLEAKHNQQRYAPYPATPTSTTVARRARGTVAVEKPKKTCLICDDKATGLHYGITSCEGCKGFFKRSIANRRIYTCKKVHNCNMSRKDRNRCQFCRLKKCLEQGMNRKAIREDGMPGGRNKSIGPVNEDPIAIRRILSGQEYRDQDIIEAERKRVLEEEEARNRGIAGPPIPPQLTEAPQIMEIGSHPLAPPSARRDANTTVLSNEPPRPCATVISPAYYQSTEGPIHSPLVINSRLLRYRDQEPPSHNLPQQRAQHNMAPRYPSAAPFTGEQGGSQSKNGWNGVPQQQQRFPNHQHAYNQTHNKPMNLPTTQSANASEPYWKPEASHNNNLPSMPSHNASNCMFNSTVGPSTSNVANTSNNRTTTAPEAMDVDIMSVNVNGVSGNTSANNPTISEQNGEAQKRWEATSHINGVDDNFKVPVPRRHSRAELEQEIKKNMSVSIYIRDIEDPTCLFLPSFTDLWNLGEKRKLRERDWLRCIACICDESITRYGSWGQRVQKGLGQCLCINDLGSLLTQTWYGAVIMETSILHREMMDEMMGKFIDTIGDGSCEKDVAIGNVCLDELDRTFVQAACHVYKLFEDMKLDTEEYGLLKTIYFFQHDVCQLENPAEVKNIHDIIMNIAKTVCKSRDQFGNESLNQDPRKNSYTDRLGILLKNMVVIKNMAKYLERLPHKKWKLVLKRFIYGTKSWKIREVAPVFNFSKAYEEEPYLQMATEIKKKRAKQMKKVKKMKRRNKRNKNIIPKKKAKMHAPNAANVQFDIRMSPVQSSPNVSMPQSSNARSTRNVSPINYCTSLEKNSNIPNTGSSSSQAETTQNTVRNTKNAEINQCTFGIGRDSDCEMDELDVEVVVPTLTTVVQNAPMPASVSGSFSMQNHQQSASCSAQTQNRETVANQKAAEPQHINTNNVSMFQYQSHATQQHVPASIPSSIATPPPASSAAHPAAPLMNLVRASHGMAYQPSNIDHMRQLSMRTNTPSGLQGASAPPAAAPLPGQNHIGIAGMNYLGQNIGMANLANVGHSQFYDISALSAAAQAAQSSASNQFAQNPAPPLYARTSFPGPNALFAPSSNLPGFFIPGLNYPSYTTPNPNMHVFNTIMNQANVAHYTGQFNPYILGATGLSQPTRTPHHSENGHGHGRNENDPKQ